MKVVLQRLVFTVEEFDLPEECPKCGADLTDKNETDAYPLVEQQLTATGQRCQLTSYPSGHITAEYDAMEVAADEQFVVGYACGECDHILVSTEGINCNCEHCLDGRTSGGKVIVDSDGHSIDEIFPGLTAICYPPKGDGE